MAEVVEAIYFSKKADFYKDILLHFQELNIIEPKHMRIVQKDNWTDESGKEIGEEDIALALRDSKIVWTDCKVAKGYAGLNVERKDNIYLLNIWFNCKEYSCGGGYGRLLKMFMEIAKKYGKDDLILCGFGEELLVEYYPDMADIVKNAHNVDVWMFSKDSGVYKRLSADAKKGYEKTYAGNYDVLIKKSPEIKDLKLQAWC
ncbi:MAG: hypothetical protein K6G60_03260 [Lachnospiraceae bacterium]|nr:hypothetical protein [Lachnospiraceae bacterium]